MALNEKACSIKFAVFCFFAAAACGLYCGNDPFVCSKRAILASVVGYIVAKIAIKIINVIIFEEVVKDFAKKQMNNDNES